MLVHYVPALPFPEGMEITTYEEKDLGGFDRASTGTCARGIISCHKRDTRKCPAG